MLKLKVERDGEDTDDYYIISKQLFMYFGTVYGGALCIVPNSYLFGDTQPIR